ncbi:MAG: DNA-processing protein DprA, partial [bacterium]|nr:DNA-processing protein DprA [bacterium]
GLARGIDTETHRGALEAGGRTIAVLGCGLGEQYPAENEELRREIARQGAVISEFPWEMRPYPQNFPRRNRLISGLALGTLVIEASLRSGALLTGRLAREQGRELMALPGSIETGRSAGSHHLIREGAHLVEKTEDILDALPDFVQKALGGAVAKPRTAADPPASLPALPPEEAALIPLLDQGETSIEELSQASAQRPELVSGALLSLELKGLVRQTAGGRFERAR